MDSTGLQFSAVRKLVGPLAVISSGLVAIQPWFGMVAVCSDDFTFHLLRLVQLDALIREGVLYTRWAPDMALGYGYPLFNFYAPLSYYFPVVLTLLGVSAPRALIVAFMGAILGAGLGVYLWARDLLSSRGALVAAIAIMYSPYLGYDVFFRGNLAESVAWVMMPLSLWSMTRLVRRGGGGWLGAAALLYAAMVLTHNAFALTFSPLLVAVAVATSWALPVRRKRWQRLGMAAGAMALGLGLAAFFWAPALHERSAVHIDRLLVPPVFVYWNNFIDLRELLALPQMIHADLLNPSPPRALGLVTVLLAVPTVIGIRRARSVLVRAMIVCCTLAAAGYTWLTTGSSGTVWAGLPLLQVVQFPWRLLGPAAVCLALLVGSAVDLLPSHWPGTLCAVLAAAAIVLGSLFWFDPRYCPVRETYDVGDIVEFEQASYTIGTTAKGEYLPRTATYLPDVPAATLINEESLPPGSLYDEQQLPIGGALVVTATEPFTAVVNVLDYPGWQVTVDGARATTAPEKDIGRITFGVPAGEHEIVVRFTETPTRAVADAASLASAAILGILWAIAVVGLKRRPPQRAVRPRRERRLSWAWLAFGAVMLGGVSLLRKVDNPLIHQGLSGGRLPGLDVELNTAFEGGLVLLGYNLVDEVVSADDVARVDLYWTTWEPPRGRYQRTLAVLDGDGLRWSHRDTAAPRDFRSPPQTWAWPPGTFAQDSHEVALIAGTQPGVYDLELTLFEHDSLRPMRVLEPEGRAGGPSLAIGLLRVARPVHPVDPQSMTMQYRLDLELGSLMLLGMDVDRREAAPGDPYLLTLFWLARDTMKTDATIDVEMLRASGETPEVRFARIPVGARLPTSRWDVSDVWRGQYPLRLPAAMEDGHYRLRLTLWPDGDTVELPVDLSVSAPDRLFEAPQVCCPQGILFGGLATLIGYDLDPSTARAGEVVTVKLVWQAEVETSDSYRVFVHLVDGDGVTVAQSDGVPAEWSRPTSGWAPGEYILDTHLLNIPEGLLDGAYELRVGLYDTESGRLVTDDGNDYADLGSVTVEPHTD
ncbi:MAG: hypothetical protein GX620_13160 [Chloroflexi bacterium]|nr:hypothetical protein [Chloroflexota bacterium]